MENFQSIIFDLANKRGVIPEIPLSELNPKFIAKLKEEVAELEDALNQKGYIDTQELCDCFIVICNCASANGIRDIELHAIEKATKDVTRKVKQI